MITNAHVGRRRLPRAGAAPVLVLAALTGCGSDAYLDEEEQAEVRDFCGPGGALNIPFYISPISIAFNLPGIQELNLDAGTTARIFPHEITRWDAPAIAAQNPDVELPTERSQGNAGVVSLTAETEGAVTCADDSLVDDSPGKARVKVRPEYVAVSGAAAGNAVGEASRVEGTGPHDVALELDREPDASGACPVVLVFYHIHCSSYADPEVLELAKAFGHYVVSEEGQQASSEAVESAPLPENLTAEAQAAVVDTTGTGGRTRLAVR